MSGEFIQFSCLDKFVRIVSHVLSNNRSNVLLAKVLCSTVALFCRRYYM